MCNIYRYYSRTFGYGLIDVGLLVSNARVWTNVGVQRNCTITNSDQKVKLAAGESGSSSIDVDDCDEIEYVEHVQVSLTTSKNEFNKLVIRVTVKTVVKICVIIT